MIRIYASHRLEDLVGALEEALPPPGRLFDGPWLVVPGRPTELYIDLALARRRGISGNIDTLSLRGLFTRLVAAATPEVVLVDRTLLLGELLAVISPSASPPGDADEPLRPIAAYLRAGGTDPENIDRRRVELARALASLFDEWDRTRPARMSSWRREQSTVRPVRTSPAGASSHAALLEPSDDPALLAAERRLWEMLHGADGRFARRGRREARRYLTLDAGVEQGLDAGWAPPEAIHLFGFSELPRGWQPALERLAARTSLSIYAYNPCREFWEDLETRRRAPPAPRGRSKAAGARVSERQLALGLFGNEAAATSSPAPAPDQALGEDDNPCLVRWGRPGRDAARAWGQLGDGDSDARFGALDAAGGSPSSLLGAIQRDIVTAEPARTGARRLDLPPDESLLVWRAPDARREIETVAGQIWRLVRGDGEDNNPSAASHELGRPPWRFSDVALMVAGPDEPYRSLVPSVFHEASRLPYTVVDGALAASSRMTEALLGLLALPLGPLTRREVLDVLTHPNVRARFPAADPAVWLALCEALGIARGADRRALGESYLDRDAFSWEQGLRRLAAGRFATGSRSGAEDPLLLPDPGGVGEAAAAPYLPAELAPDFRPDADALALLVRSLLADVRFARGASLPVPEWIRFVHALCDAYVLPISPDDEAARLHIFAALDRLAVAAAPDVAVSLGVARDLVRDALGELRGTRGQVFGNGVVVGSIGNLRTLPFRAIFVVGLGPDRFPASARPHPLDPGGPREPGDATFADRDRYTFLQAVLAAEERLALSAVDRDPATGDVRDPSPVVLELIDVVAAGYTRTPAFVRDIPRDRDQDPLVRQVFPVARAEAEARALGAALAARVPEIGQLGEAEVCGALSSAARETLAPLFGLAGPHAAAPLGRAVLAGRTRAPRPRILRIADVRRFLECPLQGGARLTLGLRHLADDTEARDTTDEPFDIPVGVEPAFLVELFTAVWDEAPPPDPAALAGAYDLVIRRQRIARVLPAGLFATAARRRHLDLLASWRAAALEVNALAGPPVDVCVGRPDGTPLVAPPAGSRTDWREALRFRVAAPDRETELDVELRGRVAPEIVVGGDGSSLLLAASPHARPELEELRLVLDHVLVSASAPAHAPARQRRGLILRPPDPTAKTPKPSCKVIDFPPLTRERAQAYLAALVTDIFSRTHDYLLPHEAIFMHAKDGKGVKGELVDCIAEVRDDPYYRRRAVSARGPVAEWFTYPIPAPAEAHAMVERRFGLLFELRPPPRPRPKEDE